MSHAAKQAGSGGIAWLQGCTHISQARQAWFWAQAPTGPPQCWSEQPWQVLPIPPLDELAVDEPTKPELVDDAMPPSLHMAMQV